MDVLRPKLLVIDGRQYRLNTADCCSANEDNVENQMNNNENFPSYVEKDGEIFRILLNVVIVYTIYFLTMFTVWHKHNLSFNS